MSSKDADCPECVQGKVQAESKAAATTAEDGLRLGTCAPVYKVWADCIEQHNGQAKECLASMKEFRKCHADLLKSASKQ